MKKMKNNLNPSSRFFGEENIPLIQQMFEIRDERKQKEFFKKYRPAILEEFELHQKTLEPQTVHLVEKMKKKGE